MINQQHNSSSENQIVHLIYDTSISSSQVNSLSARNAATQTELKQRIPELLDLEKLIRHYSSAAIDVRIEEFVHWQEHTLPLYSLTLGSHEAAAPTVLITAGMHGVERIGSQVVIAWLETLLERLTWDKQLQEQIAQVQLVIMPLLNPVGMLLNRRSNGNCVDLNRNAPIDAEDDVQFLGGGHRLSTRLPWYRGKKNAAMEAENLALERVINRQVLNRPIALVLDLHSGFGTQDRLWFPYAYRRKPIDNIAEYLALKLLWERTYPNQIYIFEPQSIHYLSHGDMWDYFYQQAKQFSECHFLPLTLEMGSWAWVKKRPRQILNFAGLFNPQMKHRHSRVLRRHILLLDFMLAAALNSNNWLPDSKQSALLKQAAKNLWFP